METMNNVQSRSNSNYNFYTSNGWAGKNYDRNLKGKDIAAKVRAFVKNEFPDFKFSIRSKFGMLADTIYITVLSGPIPALCEGNTRPYESSISGFGDAFKGRITDKMLAVLDKVYSFVSSFRYSDCDGMIDYFDTNFYCWMYVGRPYQITEKKERNNNHANNPNQSREVKPVESVSGFEIVEYSEKSIAVFGDTKSIKDELKALCGKFNPALKNNGEKRAGWIFPKKQADKVRALLAPAACVDPETSQILEQEEQGKELVKLYNIMFGVGKAKYVVNYHDGVKKYNDGSRFYDTKLFSNKLEMNKFIKFLKKEGYKLDTFFKNQELVKEEIEKREEIIMDSPAYGDSETSQNFNTKEKVKPVVEHYFVKKKTDLEQLIESGDLDSINEMIRQKEKALNNAIENVNYCKEVNNIEFMENEEVRARRLQGDLELLKTAIKETSNTKKMDSPAYVDSETSPNIGDIERELEEKAERIRERFPLEGVTAEEDTTGPNDMIYFTVEGAGPVTGARVRADLKPGDTFNVYTKDVRRYVVTYDGVSLNRSIWNELPDIVEYEEKYYPEDCPTDADGNRFYTDTREDYAPFPYVVVDRLDGSVWFFTDSEDEAKEWAADYNREYSDAGKRKTQPDVEYEVTRTDRSKCAG